MTRSRIITSSIGIIALTSFASSDDRRVPGDDDAPASIIVTGNHRTHRDVILAAAAIGTIEDSALEDVRQRILNLRLFETVAVTRDAAGNVVIHVKERWTLFPIPFISSSSRGTQGGLFLLESNLFGRNKTVALGGSYATWGASGFALYQDPAVDGTRATVRASVLYGKTLRERHVGGDIVFAYEDERLDATLLGGYRFTDQITVSAGWFVTAIDAAADAEYAPMPLAGGLVHGGTASVELRAADFKLFYDEGVTATIRYRHGLEGLGSDRDLVHLFGRAAYTRVLIGRQATTLMVQGDYVDGHPIVDARLLGGRAGARGFVLDGIWADRDLTATLEHQVPIFEPGWGTWTVNAFVDAGHLAFDGTSDRFVTPGLGLRLYLRKMNFPAVGFDVSYSLDREKIFASAAIGLSM